MTDGKLFLAVALSGFSLEIVESIVVRKEASDVFSPKAGWRCFFFVAIAVDVFGFIYLLPASHRTPKGPPLWWPLLFLLILLFARPKTLAVNSEGLNSFGWYGLRRRFIGWPDVSSVTSDWEEERLTQNFLTLIWVFTGYSVTVIGQDATRIVHTILLRHQGKFLDELRLHIPARAFAPGVFDWHP